MDVLRVLVEEAQCNLEVRSKKGLTPFLVAVQAGQSKALEWMSGSGAEVHAMLPSGATAMFLAAQEGHIECVEILHFLGVSLDQPRSDGCTPAFMAAAKGHYDVINTLGEKGADLLRPNNNGITPLQASTESNVPHRSETLKALSIHGAGGNACSATCKQLCRLTIDLLCACRSSSPPSRGDGDSSGDAQRQ